MNIVAKTIDHKSHRYPTMGDYFYKGDTLHFLISNLSNKDYEFLILIHEMTEQYLTEREGIKEKDITKFDVAFENGDLPGSKECDEPGNHEYSPYKKQHRFSENLERLLAHEMGIDFNEYSKFLDEFWKKNTSKNKKRIEINPEIGK